MRVQKRKSALFILIFFLLAVFCAPPSHTSDPVPGPSIIDIAAFEAVKRFGNQSSAHFLTAFYDLEGHPAVHLFLVTKDQESIPEDIEESIEEGRRLLEEGESLIDSGKTEEGERVIAMGETLLHQEDRYGTLLVSAKQEEPCLIAFHHGLPTYVIAKREAEERAEAFLNGKHPTLLGVLYLSPLEYYFEFEVEARRILASPFNSEIVSRGDLEKNIQYPYLPVFEENGDDPPDRIQRDLHDLREQDYTEVGRLGQTPYSQIIADVPDYNQRPWLSKSCGPTAGACLLGYWDAQGYENLLGGAGTYNDVTGLIEELCSAMAWDPSVGVYYSQIPVGLRHIIDGRGYEFGIGSSYSIDSLDIVRVEINAARPFVYGSQQNPWGVSHYVVVVGYDGNFVIVHDNWWSTPVDYFVNWDALGHYDDMMTTIIPEGQPHDDPLPSDLGGSGGGCFITAILKEK